jgi:hypothetical protein
MITTPLGPEFVKNDDQSGAKSGDHTHLDDRTATRPDMPCDREATQQVRRNFPMEATVVGGDDDDGLGVDLRCAMPSTGSSSRTFLRNI